MTPTATTLAARGTGTKTRAAASASTAGHRSALESAPSPRSPRRVSGPLGGPERARRATGANGSATAPRRASGATAAPRRVSGPARPATAPRRRRRAAAPAGRAGRAGRVTRAAAFARALPDHQLLDRIVRGRAWIPLLGVLLAGIVAMQVEVLKLGARMGASIQRTTALQSRNELLQASVASLADDQRIERLAAGMGMIMPAPDAVNFLSNNTAGYVQRAASSIHAPDAAAFLASLPASTQTAAAGTTGTTAATGTPAATGTAAASTGAPSTGTPAAAGAAAAGTSTTPASNGG